MERSGSIDSRLSGFEEKIKSVRSYGVTRLGQKRARESAYPGGGGQLTLWSLMRLPRTMNKYWLIVKTLVLGTAFRQGKMFGDGSDSSHNKSVFW